MSNYNIDDETMNEIRKFVNIDGMCDATKQAVIHTTLDWYDHIIDTLMDDLVDKHHELMLI